MRAAAVLGQLGCVVRTDGPAAAESAAGVRRQVSKELDDALHVGETSTVVFPTTRSARAGAGGGPRSLTECHGKFYVGNGSARTAQPTTSFA